LLADGLTFGEHLADNVHHKLTYLCSPCVVAATVSDRGN